MRVAWWVVTFAGAASTGCGLILDFDEIADLPCPCDPNHVCLVQSDRCVPRGSVDLFKSCTLDAEAPDDLCPPEAICESVNGLGHRCLPKCTPVSYATPEANLIVSAFCPAGTTCWSVGERGGVCSEGVCEPLGQPCPIGQRCVQFNSGAGVCFTTCDIFERDPPACGGSQVCHPIADSTETACIESGTVQLGDICTDDHMCARLDDITGRPMVCDRPANSPPDAPRKCRTICPNLDISWCHPEIEDACVLSRPGVGRNGESLGLCI